MPVAPGAGLGDAGAAGGVGGVASDETATLSKVDAFRTVASWLVTTRPMTAFAATESVVLPTVRQSDPSAEIDPTIVDPDRVSFSQVGRACEALLSHDVTALVDGRVMNSIWLAGSTSSITCAAFAASDSRLITPAFAFAFVFCKFVTRATICASPAMPCSTNWNASDEAQISAPAP